MNRLPVFARNCLSVLLTIGALAIAGRAGAQELQTPTAPAPVTRELTSKIIPSKGKTWGYDILSAGKLVIHQPTPPGMAGNEGFKTKEAAAKVAALVITKMKRGEMPPTVTIDEMKRLKAL